jgi:hypothetical protein
MAMSATGSNQVGVAPASRLLATFDSLLIQWLLDPGAVPKGAQLAQAIERLSRLA